MEVKDVLCMNKGEGQTSYAHNSSFTQKVLSITKPVLQNAIEFLFSKDFPLPQVFTAADLGSAAGPNTYDVISTIKGSIEKKCRELNCKTPEIHVYLNDLPGNDFNTLFKGLSRRDEGHSCFVVGAPGSFYGRLFPRNSLHLVHSSYSLHWLSQIPRGLTTNEGLALNKGKIYISKTSPLGVRDAYLAQFQEDFTVFLRARSEEMVPNGSMVLVLQGRRSPYPSSKDSTYEFELLAEVISQMISEGLISEDKLDSFNVPYHGPSAEELQEIVENEGSFRVELLQTFMLDRAAVVDMAGVDTRTRVEMHTRAIRSFTESMFANQFGAELMDNLYGRLAQLMTVEWAKETPNTTNLILVLSKIDIMTC